MELAPVVKIFDASTLASLPFYNNITQKVCKNFVTLQRLLTTIFINEVHNHQ